MSDFPDPAPMPEPDGFDENPFRQPGEGRAEPKKFIQPEGATPSGPVPDGPFPEDDDWVYEMEPDPRPDAADAPPPRAPRWTFDADGRPRPTAVQQGIPRCWQCGYELTGLGVDDNCPECGTAIWSRPPISNASKTASNAQLWGVLSLVFFFACIGPLAALLTIPAFSLARKAESEIRMGLIDPSQISGIKAARVCSWITLVLSGVVVLFYGVVFLIAIT